MGSSVGSPLAWAAFLALVGVALTFDALVVHRVPRELTLREAAAWSALWVCLALAACAGIAVVAGAPPALDFLSAYLLEKSLSVDNLFVFVAVFAHFGVPARLQHRALSLGILGAVLMRGTFILGGVALVARFHWLPYALALLVVYAGLKLLFGRQDSSDPSASFVVRWASRVLPVASDYGSGSLMIRRAGKRLASPLIVVLVVIELTDVVFAADSVPAVLSVTTDPFIAFTSNILAVLGLRALYFLVIGLLREARYLRVGVAVVLLFVGGKVLASPWYRIPVWSCLLVIAAVLAVTFLASALTRPRAAP